MAFKGIEKTVEIIIDAGQRLKCAIETRTRALLIYHHFKRCVHEFQYDPHLVAAACLSLTLKYNEEKVEFASVILVFFSMVEGCQPRLRGNDRFTMMCKSVTTMELLVSRMIQFCLNHTLPFDYLKCLLFSLQEPLVACNQWDSVTETSLKIASDFYLSDKCLNYKPEQIAVIAIRSSLYALGVNVDETYLKDWIKVLDESDERTKHYLTNDIYEILSLANESDKK